MHPIRTTMRFIEDCSGDLHSEEVVERLVRLVGDFGLEHFAYPGPALPSRPLCQPVMSKGWPLEWYRRYRERNYLLVDGMAQWAMRASQPFTYGEVPDSLRRPQIARRVRAEAAAFGLADGFVIPIGLAGRRRSVAIFNTSSRCDLGPQHRAALHLLTTYALGCIRPSCASAPEHGRLSVREREVLTWTAEGKSAWETSIILSLSERTVTKHLERIRTKLNAANTTQAVAEALRFGEIVL